jgi:hypothetical protein
MKTPATRAGAGLLLAACTLLPACSAEPADPLDAVAGFVGKWSGTHRLLGVEEVFEASYVIERVEDQLVWDFVSTFQGGFTGHAELSWDATRGKWSESWRDSGGDEDSLAYGDWDAEDSTLRSSSQGVDWTDPSIKVTIHNTTVLQADDFDYTMTFSYPDGRTTEVMWIHMTRVPD